MAVRFIIGRAGSGKSHQCVDQICSLLASGDHSSRLIFLAPEQATFQLEQAILKDGRVKGYHNLEVTSFIRLAKKATQDMPANSLRVLSKTARNLMLYRLLRKSQDSLKIFRGEITTGFCDQISQILSELRRYDKKPGDLQQESVKLLATGQENLIPLAAKLQDLAIIQQQWQEMLQDKYLDPEEYLDYLAEYYQTKELPANTTIWIDSFAGFTPQQFKVLTLLMKQARQCNICLNLDVKMDEFTQAVKPGYNLDQTNIFYPTLESYQRLMNICLSEGIAIEPATILPQACSTTIPRFSQSKTLANIEEFVFSDRRPVSPDGDVDSALEIVQAPNQTEEIRAIARKIIALCRDGGLRFNQIAIIARDLTGREETIAATLEEYNIPYFMDANRPVNHHPLIKLIRSAFELLTDNFRIDAIFDYIKTDLAPLTRPQADALENYCITTGVFGSSWLSSEPWHCQTREFQKGPRKNTFQSSLEEIDQLRRQAIAPLLKMKNNIAAAGKEPGVKVITRSLMELLEDLEVPQKLTQWQQNADQQGDLKDQQVHSQIFSDFIDILNELVGALDNFPLTLREYSDILFSALSQMSLRLVPPCLDQVLVGTIERSRQPEIKAAFILGMNDGIFPKHSSSTAIITDRQRAILSANKFELAPAAGIKLLQEKYLAYIAFTRASQYLWVSYCSSDSSDKILNESPFIKDLKISCGKEAITILSDSRSSSSADRITNQEQLAMELTAALADMRDNGRPEPFWQRLYQQAGPEFLPEIAKEGLLSRNKAELSPEIAKQIVGTDHMETSISKLEEYSRCPFRFFSKYMLKLNERKPFGLQAVDMGSYYHAVLCEEFRILKNRGQNWHELENEQLPQLVEDASQEVCRSNPEVIELIEKTSRNSYMFAKARQDLVKLSVTICQAARSSNFRQEQAEFGFGSHNDQTTGLHLTLPDAYKVILTGKIDRIDTYCQQGQNKAVAIYDYKLSDKKFDWVKFYSGLELQLACYLLIASKQYQGGKNQPAGMFFLETRPATIRYKTPIPQNQDSSEPQFNSAGVKYNGLVNTDFALDLETNLESSSQFYSGLKKPKTGDNAGLVTGSNCVSGQTIEAVMTYSRKILTNIANNIITGKTDILPYRYKMETACTNCPYDQVCRFDQSLDQYREISTCDAESIKDLITRENHNNSD